MPGGCSPSGFARRALVFVAVSQIERRTRNRRGKRHNRALPFTAANGLKGGRVVQANSPRALDDGARGICQSGRSGRRRFARAFVCCLLLNGAASAGDLPQPVEKSRVKRVLVVYGARHDLPSIRAFESGLNKGLGAKVRELEIFSEHIDFQRFPADGQGHEVSRYLRERYSGLNIDLVVSTPGHALDFLIANRDRLLPGVPIVFCEIAEQRAVPSLPQGVHGVIFSYDFAGTLKLMRALQPDVREVLVVGGTASGYQRGARDTQGYRRR